MPANATGERATRRRIVEGGLNSPGDAVDADLRGPLESRWGVDMRDVRVHSDPQARASADDLDTAAYTFGTDIVMGSGGNAPDAPQHQKILAHELAHVVQQRGAIGSLPETISTDQAAETQAQQASSTRSGRAAVPLSGLGKRAVQRYESGEHAKLGETGEAMSELVAKRALKYIVRKGETPTFLAAKFGLSEDELRAANPGKWKTWPGSSGNAVSGFNAGEVLLIPPVLNQATKDALTQKQLIMVVNGATIEYGEGIAMGDFFADPTQMSGASAKELNSLTALIKKDKAGPAGVVTTAEWDAATANRYHSLAAQNEAHFAPSSSGLAPISGKSAFDHKSAYEDYHRRAIRASQSGNRDSALTLNSFADHFLTDAFAAGHLFNKRDVMQLFNSRLPMNASNEFTSASVAFFDAVAAQAWTGDVAREFSRYETVEFKGVVFRPNIDSQGRFSTLLQGIHQKEPDLMANAVAKSVHDTLNRAPGGIPVTNSLGDTWSLSGDKTMNLQTQLIARRAVAQSLLDVLEGFKTTTSVDIASLNKRAWDYVPQLTAVGRAETARAVTSGTDPSSKGLIQQAAALLSENYRLIIAELVKRKILKPT